MGNKHRGSGYTHNNWYLFKETINYYFSNFDFFEQGS